MSVLYLSYDGLMEPLGHSQVFEYLRTLAGEYRITLITYEKSEDWADRERREALAGKVRQAGISWYALRYHKKPTLLATSYDILVGFILASFLVLRQNIQIVHARSYVPSVIAITLKKCFGTKFLFDMRGFWADERIDSGLWKPNSVLYFVGKLFERRFLLSSDLVVSLTAAAAKEIKSFAYLQDRMPRIEIIPTCANLELFRPARRFHLSSAVGHVRFTLGHVGSVKLWYMFDEFLRCFCFLKEVVPTAQLLILNRGEHSYIRDRLATFSIPNDCVELRAVNHLDVPSQIARMNASAFLIRPTYSKIGSAPTKLAELLGCGVPCLGNAGIGDMEAILEGERVGVILREFAEYTMRLAMEQLVQLALDPETPARCRRTAEHYFSLKNGVRAYDRIYRYLADT